MDEKNEVILICSNFNNNDNEENETLQIADSVQLEVRVSS